MTGEPTHLGTQAVRMLDTVAKASLAQVKADRRAKPPQEWPPALRPYLSFKKLKPAAVQAIVRVVDAEPDFRERVGRSADESAFGLAGWLWLTRPAGWQDKFDALVEAHHEVSEARETAQQERDAGKRLIVVQRALDEAQAKVATLEGEAATASERSIAFEREHQELIGRVAEVEVARDQATVERERAVRELKETEARLATKLADLRAAQARIETLQSQPPSVGAAPTPEPASADPSRIDLAELSEIVHDRATEAIRLARELDDLARHIAPHEREPASAPAPPPSTGQVATPFEPVASPASATSAPARSTKRRPQLPPGIRDDTHDAAAHLCRNPGAVLLIDGYNVSMSAWPEASAMHQRSGLERLLSEWTNRWGCAITVFWDGAEESASAVRTPAGLLRVEFTAVDVEADDAIIERAQQLDVQLPLDQGIVAVSSDNRVRDGAARWGAGVVHSAMFLTITRG